MLKPPITYSWLGGFFQAEGHINYGELLIGQAHQDILVDITDFIKLETGAYVSVIGPLTNNDSFYYRLRVGKGWRIVLSNILPYLHYDKRQRGLKCIKNKVVPEMPIDDDWIMGFWEGDGTLRSSGNSFDFAQKDRRLLEDVRNYLKLGGTITQGTSCLQLRVGVNKSNVQRVGTLLRRLRCQHRIDQVEKIFAAVLS